MDINTVIRDLMEVEKGKLDKIMLELNLIKDFAKKNEISVVRFGLIGAIVARQVHKKMENDET